MNKITSVIDKAQDTATTAGAKALVAATNFTGKAMNTRIGKAALVVPMIMSACAVTAHASSSGDVSAQSMIDTILGVLGPGVIALGSLVAIVGGIQTGIGFKDDNADGKTRGFQTLIGGAIIAAVGGIVPTTLGNFNG